MLNFQTHVLRKNLSKWKNIINKKKKRCWIFSIIIQDTYLSYYNIFYSNFIFQKVYLYYRRFFFPLYVWNFNEKQLLLMLFIYYRSCYRLPIDHINCVPVIIQKDAVCVIFGPIRARFIFYFFFYLTIMKLKYGLHNMTFMSCVSVKYFQFLYTSLFSISQNLSNKDAINSIFKFRLKI